MKKPFARATILLLLPIAAIAQQPASGPTLLQPVEVRGEGAAGPGYAATRVIGRAEIERAQVNDVSELLRRVAGVEVNRLGGIGQQTSVFVRGANSNSTVIAIDGVRINSAFGGAAIQNLRPSMIERIEVTKGARSTQWGPGAVGGVINIITRRQGNDAGVALRAGSQDTRDASAHFRRATEEGHLGLVLDYLESDGLPALEGGEDPSGNRNFSGLVQMGSKLDTVAIDTTYLITRGRSQFQDNGTNFDLFDTQAADFRSEVAIISASEQMSEQWHSRISASYTQDDRRQRDPRERTRSTLREVEWVNTVSEGAQNITFAARGAREDLDTQFAFAEFDQRRYFWSVSAIDEVRIDNQRVAIGLAYLDDKAYGSAVTWSAEYGIDVSEAWTLFALTGTAVRAPDPFDRLPPFGNPDVDAEKARNIEFGAQRRFAANAQAELRVFRADVRNLIANDPVSFEPGNIGRSRNEGLEASGYWAPGDWLINLSAVWQDPRDARTGNRLARRAKHTATAEVLRRFGHRFELGTELVASGDRPDIDAISFAPTRSAGYAVVSMTGAYRVTPALTLRGRVENLGDIDYQTVSGYNQPDRSYYVSIDYRWRQ
jgi:vitamin B12 transporter